MTRLLFFPPIVGALLVFWAPPDPMRIRVEPKQGYAPMSIAVTVTIPQNARNREMCVGITGDTQELDRFSCHTIDGENERVTQQFYYHKLPLGHYLVYGKLAREGDSVFEAYAKVNVLGGGD